MSTLDDKLLELYDGHPDQASEFVAAVKQAFADEGYTKNTSYTKYHKKYHEKIVRKRAAGLDDGK